MSRVLVTGGAGTIGAHLCTKLRAQGHDITVLDDLSSGYKEHLPSGLRFLQGSVAEDNDLAEAFEFKPQTVFHAAALFANQNSVDHPRKDLLVNGMGTLKVFELCKKFNVEKVVYFSSSCVYGAQEEMSEETKKFNPETPYAITKLLGEYYSSFWCTHHHLNISVVRIFNTYGPFEYPGPYRNVIPNFFELALQKKPLPITGTGKETRSFVYVEDTVEGLLKVAQDPKPETYNLCGSEETTIEDLAQKINAIAKNPSGLQYFPRRSWDHVLRRRGNSNKALQHLGFSPTVSLDQGLKLTYEWLKTHAEKNSSHSVRLSSRGSAGSLSSS